MENFAMFAGTTMGVGGSVGGMGCKGVGSVIVLFVSKYRLKGLFSLLDCIQ